MPLTAGTRIGPYEIASVLGAGGMGEVYRARDTKLNRIVAIKSLHAAVAADPERIARFEREAQLLASLNHPNIAAIHGLQEVPVSADHAAATYLILEFVDGRPLDAILRESGAMSLSDALPVARQIADAIASAHEKGIIHRDLKPGNVMVTAEGQVKVLDFGLGKSLTPDSGSRTGDEANSPTITVGATQAGIILGTAAYMSPEQAKGKPVDKRSDVWSFGCVLYEMLTGRRAFQGDDVSDTLASVLKESPDFNRLPKDLPPAVRLVVERCLTKDRAARLSDMSTARFLLTEPSAISPGIMETALEAHRMAVATPRTMRRAWAFGMVVGTILGVVAAASWPRGAASTTAGATTHVSIRLPAGDVVDNTGQQGIAISPDGRLIVYSLLASKSRLVVHDLSGSKVRELAGTEEALYPSFSPNGQWVAFVAQNKMKKASIGGGAVDTLASVGAARGTAWGEDGYVYVARSNVGALSRVRESGGLMEEVTRLDTASGEISHRNPQVLPGARAILFTVWKGPGPDEKLVAVQRIGDREIGRHRILIRGGTDGQFVAPGYLAYSRSDRLFAVPFDLTSLDVAKSAPVQLEDLVLGEATERASMSVSTTASATLAYLPATPTRLERRLVWQDASGNVQPLPLPNRPYEQVSLAPDGTSAIVQIIDGSVGLWRLDFAQHTLTPLVTTGGTSQAAVWTRDGKRVIYRATRNGVRNLYWRTADGSGQEERLASRPGMMQTPSSLSPDGNWLVFNESGPQSDRGVYRLGLGGTKEIVRVSPDSVVENNGHVSPNGKWLAFEGTPGTEIYVRAFPGPGARTLVSRSGGSEPRWSPDGGKLYFLQDGRLFVVDVKAGGTFAAGVPRPFFSQQDVRFLISPNGVTSYDIGKDGRILRVQSIAPEPPADTINLILNWSAELARIVK